jgi:hypothetical protein
MSKRKVNQESQQRRDEISRREFFKKGGKATLTIGGLVLSVLPLTAYAASKKNPAIDNLLLGEEGYQI